VSIGLKSQAPQVSIRDRSYLLEFDTLIPIAPLLAYLKPRT
jgi:hypothetical protein